MCGTAYQCDFTTSSAPSRCALVHNIVTRKIKYYPFIVMVVILAQAMLYSNSETIMLKYVTCIHLGQLSPSVNVGMDSKERGRNGTNIASLSCTVVKGKNGRSLKS